MTCVALVWLAACVSIPDFAPSYGVNLTKGDETAVVSGPGFAVHFSTGGAHYPDSITVDGKQVLGHSAAAGCTGADQLGFQLAPISRVSADGTAMIRSTNFDVALAGPAVVQIVLEGRRAFLAKNRGNQAARHGSRCFPTARSFALTAFTTPSPTLSLRPTANAPEDRSFNSPATRASIGTAS